MGYRALYKLNQHPNFKLPLSPKIQSGFFKGENLVDDSARELMSQVIDFTCEYLAGLVSPSQVENETEERECTDVAEQIRESKRTILKALMESARKER